jgi:hypothetical protein
MKKKMHEFYSPKGGGRMLMVHDGRGEYTRDDAIRMAARIIRFEASDTELKNAGLRRV